ncbi:UDP-N-acetylmuramoylalanine--D-glutamate ligase [hydrothermal vent metagenome]|uniref:UDP-N-acetylmuramoylalanine--D-glutamate ligase n=1 Tax=hydrothermal vent metagenome TaxID=652676 RepID=A0A3B1D5T6_9ZZZZ
MNLTNKIITILGTGRSGQAAARLVHKHKGVVKVSDSGPIENIFKPFYQWLQHNNITLESGGHTQRFIKSSDMVVVSPGIPIDAQVLQWAGAKGIVIIGEMELASQFCSKPIIAVTGSNGKTTTTTLIHQVLEAEGYKSCLCGNIGRPFSECIEEINNVDYVVLEVSSFQLETIQTFHPHIAVFLNFSQNHLDRHKDMKEYLQAKVRIFENQTEEDYIILNKDLVDITKRGQVPFFISGDEYYTENQKAVLTVAEILEISSEVCDKVFKAFKGIEHRLEWVCNIDGVDYINDSKATTVEAGRWALHSMEAPVFMICGGKDKGSDFTQIRNVVHDKVKKIFVIGEVSEKITKSFEGGVEIEVCQDLIDAVKKAQHDADEGATILLSPMCASFDMFKNFEERGKVFKEIVKRGTHPLFSK